MIEKIHAKRGKTNKTYLEEYPKNLLKDLCICDCYFSVDDETIEKYIKELKELSWRMAILLHYKEHMGYAEIGRYLGITLGSARSFTDVGTRHLKCKLYHNEKEHIVRSIEEI
jgi:hypothetical protein